MKNLNEIKLISSILKECLAIDIFIDEYIGELNFSRELNSLEENLESLNLVREEQGFGFISSEIEDMENITSIISSVKNLNNICKIIFTNIIDEARVLFLSQFDNNNEFNKLVVKFLNSKHLSNKMLEDMKHLIVSCQRKSKTFNFLFKDFEGFTNKSPKIKRPIKKI